MIYNNFLVKKIINFISFYLFLTGPCTSVLVQRPFQSPIFLSNDDKICENKPSFDRSVTYIRVTGHFIFQPYRYVVACVT